MTNRLIQCRSNFNNTELRNLNGLELPGLFFVGEEMVLTCRGRCINGGGGGGAIENAGGQQFRNLRSSSVAGINIIPSLKYQ